ncbi:methenyltetrahydromethanopterin cyclohydrolase [Rubripirellula lacrimiformis]|nr:methenyltetrahydromethanopterin cyclohydrolase [Rubripirellula lacrimiformis]
MMLNQLSYELFRRSIDNAAGLNCRVASVGGAQILDAGIDTRGSLAAGLVLARLCLGDHASVKIHPADPDRLVSDNSVHVQCDHTLAACLGSQYAGWPIQTDDFFAMGSGPMRMFRGREATLKELDLSETGEHAVGVLESDKLPTESVIAMIAEQCGVQPSGVSLAVAPSTSIAGSVQVVARSIETAMHKLHELKFDVRTIVSGTGNSPLPPPAKPGDMVGGIGRTNDAMLYGASVTLWVDTDDEAIEAVAEHVPSRGSKDYGRPFAAIFQDYEYDFYKVDPMLFSPAVVTIHNLRTGRTWIHGQIATDTLRESFLS